MYTLLPATDNVLCINYDKDKLIILNIVTSMNHCVVIATTVKTNSTEEKPTYSKTYFQG